MGSWNGVAWFWEYSLSICGNLANKPGDNFGTLLNQGTAVVVAGRFLLGKEAMFSACTFRLCLGELVGRSRSVAGRALDDDLFLPAAWGDPSASLGRPQQYPNLLCRGQMCQRLPQGQSHFAEEVLLPQSSPTHAMVFQLEPLAILIWAACRSVPHIGKPKI